MPDIQLNGNELVIAVVIVAFMLLLVLHKMFMRLFGAVMIPENAYGEVSRKFTVGGKRLPDGSIIALSGEAGIQADTLAPGLHWRYWPWQYSVDILPFTIIPAGKVGVVSARDGRQIPAGRVLGRGVDCNAFQDARAFLEGGGERGPQNRIITPGTYRINRKLFDISMSDAIEIPQGKVGIVTTSDGAPLETGEIAGPEIPGHNGYQDAQKFMDSGGKKGIQEQVILAGRYFINPSFATVTLDDMTRVPIANVGVVISYVGKKGVDLSGKDFTHGDLVGPGEKGVQMAPLNPGRYPINTAISRVEIVPTANIVLNWANGKTEAHKLDEGLCTITVRSSDGFTFNLDVSQIIHISSTAAPKVIARFGTVQTLVSQVLEPLIGNYFRNAAQDSDVIQFLGSRKERQEMARTKIAEALAALDVQAVDTLIGDITPPPELMKTLTDRKLADQRNETYKNEKTAEITRKELESAKAEADTQSKVIAAQREIEIAKSAAEQAVNRATGEADAKKKIADADAYVTVQTGKADAGKIQAIGDAEAAVMKAKISSINADNYAAMNIAESIRHSHQKLVPDITVNGQNGGASITDALLAKLALTPKETIINVDRR